MTNDLFSEIGVLQRSKKSLLDPHIESFAVLLFDKGYAKFTVKLKIRQLSKLGRWLDKHEFDSNELDEQILDRFIESQSNNKTNRHGVLSTLHNFLQFLRDKDIVNTAKVKKENPFEDVEYGFVNYLSQERNISQSTIDRYISLIRPFISSCLDAKDINLNTLSVDIVNTYILSHTKTNSSTYSKLLVTALRSFFRYLYSNGKIAKNLAVSVPKVAYWRLSTLPKSLKADQVEKLLKCCDCTSNIGQRDYAILLLLARLGLRAGEIVAMRLEDIDWEAGEILIRGKGKREDRLPIPYDIGEALVRYLKNVRPNCSVRNVFIRIKAPYKGFSSSVAIRDIVDNALSRANIQSHRRGAHLFRHSLASNMLQDGASFIEIGELLRHRCQTTTEIYAKVDIQALHSLAQSWPGGGI